MDSAISDAAADPAAAGRPERAALAGTADNGLKIVVVGGFGVGKTTLVRSVSEIRPLNTEETMTRAGEEVDDTAGVAAKTATTVAFDFGRITLDARNVLYLFGAPGQERFWFLWNGLFEGALGAVVLVDTRRLEVSFDVIGRLEERGVPFVVAINSFPEAPRHDLEDLRRALDLPEYVPIFDCDARYRESSRDALMTLMRYLHEMTPATA